MIRAVVVASLLVLAVAGMAGAVFAATGEGADAQFERARELAFDEDNRADARVLCEQILDRHPNYTDVQIFLGSLMAWDGDYEDARGVLDPVVRRDPRRSDARNALIDVELWSDRPQLALNLADEGLAREPGNPDYLERRSRALDKLGRQEEALESVRRTLQIEPGSRGARQHYYGLLDETQRNKIGARYRFESFDDSTDPWNELSVEYRRSTGFGSIIGRVNLAERFDDEGSQYEVDTYPRLRRKTYAWLNLGLSSTDLFPELRYGAEVFHNFPDGWEASLGFRRLEFDTSDVTIYTGSVAKYFGGFWVAWRPQYVDKSDGSSFSNGVAIRQYYGGRYEYAEFSVGGGSKTQDDVIAGNEDRLDSFSAKAELRRRIRANLILKGSVGYRTQEFEVAGERQSYFFGVGFERHF